MIAKNKITMPSVIYFNSNINFIIFSPSLPKKFAESHHGRL